MTKDSSFGGQKQTKQKEMKRFISMIVAACTFFAASAQTPMVTLSHNGELSFFTNLNAFNSAYEAAENGDILYLSEGDFILDGGKLSITKRLSLIGTGYRSHIFGDLSLDMQNNPNSAMDAPLFDGVRLDNLTFSHFSSSSENLGESQIRRCWIRTLYNGACAGTNVTYDKCYIEKSDFDGNGNVVVKNSKLSGTDGNSYLHNINAINCNISTHDYLPNNMISCIFSYTGSGSEPTVNAIRGSISIISSLLDCSVTNPNVNKYNCYDYNSSTTSLLDDNLNCNILDLTDYLGEDGKVVGIYGGESPFSENPSVPTVDTANSSVEYDSSANKLKVTIAVKAD